MGDLASQLVKTQLAIMREPEMMWPRKGTIMMGFLPESGQDEDLDDDDDDDVDE